MRRADKPVYLLAGGSRLRRKSSDPLIGEMLRQVGHQDPFVAYIGAASGDDPWFFEAIKALFKQSGAGRVDLVELADPNDNRLKAQALLQSADVLFFSGGDVELGMKILHERGVLKLIHKRFRAGAVLGGLSAGSILLARQWLRWRDPEDDATAEPFDCIGIAPLICDMHDEDEGWEELKALLRLRQIEGETGYGIPASAGLCIHADKRIEAIGGVVQRFIFRNGRVEKTSELGLDAG